MPYINFLRKNLLRALKKLIIFFLRFTKNLLSINKIQLKYLNLSSRYTKFILYWTLIEFKNCDLVNVLYFRIYCFNNTSRLKFVTVNLTMDSNSFIRWLSGNFPIFHNGSEFWDIIGQNDENGHFGLFSSSIRLNSNIWNRNWRIKQLPLWFLNYHIFLFFFFFFFLMKSMREGDTPERCIP